MCSPPAFSGLRLLDHQFSVYCFVDYCLSFFFWSLYCLSFFDLWPLITPFAIFEFFLIGHASYCSILRFMCNVLYLVFCPLFLTIVLSVLLTTSDFKVLLVGSCCSIFSFMCSVL